MQYRVYTKREILNQGINLKGKERVFTLFFAIGYFNFGVHYYPRYFGGSLSISHFSFYALSRGFEKFTETGFRSCFVQNSKKVASYSEIKEYFIELLKEKVEFLSENSQPIQLQLF